MMRTADRQRLFAALKWASIVLGALVVLLLGVSTVTDWNFLRPAICRYASARLARPVAINGDLRAHLWSRTPHVSLSDLVIGNASWDSSAPLARVESLDVELQLFSLFRRSLVFSRVLLEHPEVYLHRDEQGRANWESNSPTNAPSSAPARLPIVRTLVVNSGELHIVDEIRHLEFRGTARAKEQAGTAGNQPFRLEGDGELNRKPFSLRLSSPSLTEVDETKPFPFKLAIEAADNQVQADGVIDRPFDLGALRVNLQSSGPDLADLYYLSGLALPNTRGYSIRAVLVRRETQFRMTDLHGTFGNSDISGELQIDASGPRPKVTGTLMSKALHIADLAASLGGAIPEQSLAAQPAIAGEVSGPRASESKTVTSDVAPLFPDARLQVNRIRGMDADVRFAAGGIGAGAVPLKGISVHAIIDRGVLSLSPFAFELPEGRLSGTARIDARNAIPKTEIDVRLSDLNLEQFKGKKGDRPPPFSGVVQAHAKLRGTGISVHDFVSNSSGSLSAVIPHGEVRAAFAELTGINVARGLGLLLTKNDDRAQLRCGVADFLVSAGVMHSQTVVFDTTNVLITGSGEVRLGPEELDLAIKGEPKKLRLLRLRSPIAIRGHLRKPVVTVDLGKTARQAGIATALSALIAPIAAIVAFVDPGLAKDANCAALLAHRRQAEVGTSNDRVVRP